MSDGRGIRSGVPGEWAPTAFLAGGLGIGAAVLLVAVQGLANVTAPGWVTVVPGLGGLLAALLGLLSYYPRVAGPAPRLGSAGAAFALVGVVLFVVAVFRVVVSTLTTGATLAERPDGVTLLLVGTLVGLALGFLCYGAASTRTRTPSRAVGHLLLVPAAGILGNVLYVTLSGALGVGVVSGAPTVSFLVAALGTVALGYRLRSEVSSADQSERADTTA